MSLNTARNVTKFQQCTAMWFVNCAEVSEVLASGWSVTWLTDHLRNSAALKSRKSHPLQTPPREFQFPQRWKYCHL
jgi:hypothetical protein